MPIFKNRPSDWNAGLGCHWMFGSNGAIFAFKFCVWRCTKRTAYQWTRTSQEKIRWENGTHQRQTWSKTFLYELFVKKIILTKRFGYWQRFLKEIVFKIPDHVLLPEDTAQRTKHTVKSHRKLLKEIENIKSEIHTVIVDILHFTVTFLIKSIFCRKSTKMPFSR